MESFFNNKRKDFTNRYYNSEPEESNKRVKRQDDWKVKVKTEDDEIDQPPKVLKDKMGLVTQLINDSYGLATVKLPDIGSVGVIFDTCEFWHDGAMLVEKCLALQTVIQVGDWVKINAIKMLEGGGDDRNILYLATAVEKAGMASKHSRNAETIKQLEDVPKQKRETFFAVLSYLASLPFSSTEKEMIRKCKESSFNGGKPDDASNPTKSATMSKISPYGWFGQLSTPSPAANQQQSAPSATTNQQASPAVGPLATNNLGLPPGFGILEGSLVKLFGDGDFLDCLMCLETLSMRLDHEFLPFYTTHLKSSEHQQKAKNSKCHKNLLKQYIGQRTIGKALILQEKESQGLESLYAHGEVEFFKCNYCQKTGVTVWHFIEMKNSQEHKKDFRLHCQNFLDGNCVKPVCKFKHYSKDFARDNDLDPGFLPDEIQRETERSLNLHPVSQLRQRQTNLGLQLPVIKKNNEVDAAGFAKRFCHVTLSLSSSHENDKRIFFGRGSTNKEAKENAAIAALAALRARQPTQPCPHGKSDVIGCWCLGARSVYQY